MPGGRPTDYREAYCEQAYKLALFGLTDDQIAWFYDISIETLAAWAWEYEVFFNAITPTPEQRAAHAEHIAERKRRRAAARISRRARNPNECVAEAMRGRIWLALKRQRINPRPGGLLSRLPYSVDDLMAHLEVRFQPGMGWHNYGKWHVDHKKPCARFNLGDSVEFQECWALSNLQPLWATDNIRKGASYAGP